MTEHDESAAGLAAAVLNDESRRHADQAARDAAPVLPDDVLLTGDDEPMSFKEALRAGGVSMVVFMFLLNVIDDLPRAVRVVAPDIQATFGISDTALTAILSFGGLALVLGAVPMARLADRIKRVAIIPIASLFWATTMALTGLAANPFQMFTTSFLTGLGQSYRIPVSNSLLADSYPVQSRNRIFAFEGTGRPVGQLLGPLLVGGVAAAAGGTEGWRWAFLVLAIPPVIVGLASIRLKEPERGKFDHEAVFGVAATEAEPEVQRDELPVSTRQAFARLKKVKTFYFLAVGVGVLGFALIAVPLQFNLLLEDKYSFGPLKRGVTESLIWVITIPLLPFAGKLFDRVFRRDPARMMTLAGTFVIASGALYLVGLLFKPIGPLVIFIALAQAAISCSFVAAAPIIAAVAPYRIRAQAFAFLPVFVFLMGGFLGGLFVAQLSDSYGNRTAMLVVAPPAAVIGGLLIMYGARFIRGDIALAVEEMVEERDETARMVADDDIPVLQVRNMDVSYGIVQVLFGAELDVHRGEVLALLGNNGAGKSTMLRAISGLLVPDRGVIRLNGRTITYTDAETRFAEGIVQLRGGEGIFPDLTIEDNLRTSVLASKLSRAETERRIDVALDRFPALRNRLGETGSNLSGGQQQMLALAMALMHEPEVLIIDELSLGLAPVIVQSLLEVIEELKEQGMTMVIVEQSVNIALSIADRAMFMEKGVVTFEGSADELAERDDLITAAFLGAQNGEPE